MPDLIQDLIDLGYRVNPANFDDESDTPTVYFIDGFGLRTYYDIDDTSGWQWVVDTHEDRIALPQRIFTPPPMT